MKQLYIRKALQHLINEELYIEPTLSGYALRDYGPVADYPASAYASPGIRKDPDPYDPEAATKLLASHGWERGQGGIDVCKRPGTASSGCRAGITKGEKLSFSVMYATGTTSFLAEVEAFQAAARSVGIGIALNG